MKKERVVVVMPGRGSYASSELGYLRKYHDSRFDLLSRFDRVVEGLGGDPASQLDALEKFSPSKHLPGRNASNLIYACALADFATIDRSKYDVVAICGNSLGWYLTLAAAGVLSLEGGARLVDTMGGLMDRDGVGGQLLYPVTDDTWRLDLEKIELVDGVIQDTPNAFHSIDLCGTKVLAGDDAAVKKMLNDLPKVDDRFPVRLPKHAAFHTPIMESVSVNARSLLPASLFGNTQIPIIDGRGQIWTPFAYSAADIHTYTLHNQIVEPYNFAKSIEVALKQFAPDRVILTGPGGSLGPPVGQCLIQNKWYGLKSRDDFSARQEKDPILLSMGRPDQRKLVVG